MDTTAPERTLLDHPAAAEVILRSGLSQDGQGLGPGYHRRQRYRWWDGQNADRAVACRGTPNPGLQAGNR